MATTGIVTQAGPDLDDQVQPNSKGDNGQRAPNEQLHECIIEKVHDPKNSWQMGDTRRSRRHAAARDRNAWMALTHYDLDTQMRPATPLQVAHSMQPAENGPTGFFGHPTRETSLARNQPANPLTTMTSRRKLTQVPCLLYLPRITA
jgi:hypothetical protein